LAHPVLVGLSNVILVTFSDNSYSRTQVGKEESFGLDNYTV